MILLAADSVVADQEVWSPGWIVVEGDLVADCGAGPPPSAESTEHIAGTIVPGFVDIHSHGAAGLDYSVAAGTSIAPALDWQLAHGTTTVIASLATAPIEQLEKQLIALDQLVRSGRIAGIHLEGPWLSPGHRGAHAMELLRSPGSTEVDRLTSIADSLRMVTIAPELPGALDAIRTIVTRGCIAAIGHTSCDASTARAAVDAGVTVATHLFNGMPVLHHRAPGPVGVALLDERVFVELVLDGHHLAPETVELALRLAGDRAVAVSDSIAATGYPEGEYMLAGTRVEVRDGLARTTVSGSLAGSTRTLDTAFRTLVRDHSASLPQAVAVTSTTPAKAMGLPDRGCIRSGAAADLIVLHDLEVRGVMKRGKWISAPPPG